MRKLLGLFLFFALLSGPLQAEPAAWKVEGENGSLIIFGTMHRLPEGTEWFSEGMMSNFKSSKALVLETRRTRAGDDLVNYFLGLPGVAITNEPLKKYLSAADYQAFLERVGPYGYTEEQVEFYRPWYALTILSRIAGDEIGLEATSGVEETLIKFAEAENMPIITLESPAQQTRLYSELPKEAEVAWLQKALEQEEEEDRSTEVLDMWTSGDIDGIQEEVISSFQEIPAVYNAFIVQRNRIWAEKFDEFLENGGLTFVAVGTAHMAGEDSVLEFLEAKGYRITRIQ